MLHPRDRALAPAWRTRRLHLTRSCPAVAQEAAPEQSDSLLHPPPLARTVRAQASASGPVPALGSHRRLKWSRRASREDLHRTFGSLFFLWAFLLQHALHNPDLGSLRIVRIRCEVEQFSVLARARSVKQIHDHCQRTI